MKLVMAVTLLVSACSFINAQEPTWKEFRSNEGGFSILMPGTPIPNKVTVNTTSGVEEANMFSLSDESLDEYIVAYSKYMKTDSKEVSTGKLFDKVRDGILLVQQGKLLNEAAITLDGYSGRSIAVERPDGVITTARFYVVDDRFYQLSVKAKTNGREPEATNRFLDSFKLLPIKQQ
ncbi:MAG TPA: hypothetical protein VFR80_13870 [Pyrinomonadaceae bacterium]|nr:hypothetical protein [Pyrinomonadaceae bacterium]